MEPKMTPQQAIELLVQASSLASLPKKDHILLERAAQLLSDLVKEKEEKPQE